MKYRYKKNQIFRKKLDVPSDVLNAIYNEYLSIVDYIKYDLEDKVPTSCIRKKDMEYVEIIGLEKAKKFDWDIINNCHPKEIPLSDGEKFFKELLEKYKDLDIEELNKSIYEELKDKVEPYHYTDKMKELYKDRLMEKNERFNHGLVNLKEIVDNWDLYKDKDLSYCLLRDTSNRFNITDSDLKRVMSKYREIIDIAKKHTNIYQLINEIASTKTEEEEKECLKRISDNVLDQTDENNKHIRYTEDQYKELFKYASLEDYLKIFNEYQGPDVAKEIEELGIDYMYNMPFPLTTLFRYDVLSFIGRFGLKNTVDFDNECGQFFSKNDCEMLKLMDDMYIHYGSNEQDPKKKIYAQPSVDEDGNPINRRYNKDEFYESMRRMIVYGPTDWDYQDKAPDYRDMTGEFRTRNSELFISEDAPEELKKLFYTKSLTPYILEKHPEYIEYLRGKDFKSCFDSRSIEVDGSDALYGLENYYEYIGSKTDFDTAIKMFIEYADTIEELTKEYTYDYQMRVSIEDDLDQIQNKINTTLKKKIIEKGIAFPKTIPESMKKNYPTMFLSEDAPEELKEAFYNRKIDTELILSNPKYIKCLENVDLAVIYPYILVKKMFGDDKEKPYYDRRYTNINFVDAVQELFEEDSFGFMILYGKYIEKLNKLEELNKFEYEADDSKDDFLDKIDKTIYKSIINGQIKYDDKISTHFKNNYPTFFLSEDVPEEIRNKFYNREFTLNDFIVDKELINYFENTNVALAFPEDNAWIAALFDSYDTKEANQNRLKVVNAYARLEDKKLKEKFKNYVIEKNNELDISKIDDIMEVFSRLEYSNSIELSSFKVSLTDLLLDTDDPIESLNKIENVFLRNNLPLCGKMFLCFQVLYPNMSEVHKFRFDSTSRVAPELKDDTLPDFGFDATNDEKRLIVIFNDLLRASYRSNERSLVEYIDNIEEGNKLYLELQNNNLNINDLNDKEKETLEIFVSHLEVLYQNTKKGKEEDLDIEKLPLEEKLKVLGKEFKPNGRYDLKDRIVRSFCYSAGIKSFDELKNLLNGSLKEQQERIDKNLKELEENGAFKFEEGDILRCIGNLDALSGSLNTGNFSKEHLGVFLGSSDSDTTPLDVDLTYIKDAENIYRSIEGTPTGFGFGNVFIIIKKDNPNFYTTRDKDGNLTGEKYNPKKVEIFGTSTEAGGYETHWGARTGISMVDIDYILFKGKNSIDSNNPYDENGNVNYANKTAEDEREYQRELASIKFELARNGYYIPVIDFSGKLIFTKEEFNELRNKMQGLSHYNENTFEISESLINPEVAEIASTLTEESKESTNNKRNQVNAIVKEVLDEMGLSIKYKMDGDLSTNSVEFIDTGSTGRDTNVPYDGDFDFYMRLDADIIRKPDVFNEFKSKLEAKFKEHNIEYCGYTDMGDMRIKGVHLESGEVVDVDISFGVKTNKVKYSSDECLKDRLRTIKKLHPDKYKYVVANIIMAKKFLKDPEVNAYKPRRTDSNQGGIGGVGVENWILQNGGSFTEACRTFVEAAFDKKTGELIPFDEFKKKYQIWDFGENHFAARKGGYLYDNFVENNMNETGYKKMAEAFQMYLKKVDSKEELNQMTK